MKLWIMVIHDPDGGVRTARAFATRDDAIRAIRTAINGVEREFDSDAADEAMVQWDKALAELTAGGDTVLPTDWDSHAVIELRETELE